MGSSIAFSSTFRLKFPLAEVFAPRTLNGIPPNVIGCVLYWLSIGCMILVGQRRAMELRKTELAYIVYKL